MFFVLSKIAAYLIMPYVVFCALLIYAAITKKPERKRKIFLGTLIAMLVLSNDFLANEAMKAWEVPLTPIADLHKKYEWAIVLTGVTKHEPGPHDRVFFNRGADRVTHTVQLYKMGVVKKILVSGGSGRLSAVDRKEADEIEQAFLLMGVAPEDIRKETESRNTHESAVATRSILAKITSPDSCLLITSSYHMRRSAACFKKVGWPMDTFTVDFLSHQRNFHFDTLVIPKMEAMGNWQLLIKEWVGMLSYKIAGYI